MYEEHAVTGPERPICSTPITCCSVAQIAWFPIADPVPEERKMAQCK